MLGMRPLALARRYSRAFGPRHGLPACAALHAPGAGVASVVLPGILAPLVLRRGTVDVDVFGQIFIDREYDARHLPQWKALDRHYQAISRRGKRPLIVDCGAHIGMASVFFHHFFPSAQIVAIEPAPGNFELLAQNAGAYPSITPVRAAVSDRVEAVRIVDAGAESWAFQVEAAGGGPSTLETVTLDDVMRSAAGTEPLIVKVDIEGGEEQLFRDNLAWLARTPLLIIEIHDWMKPWSGSSRTLWRAIASLDVDVCVRGENVFVFNGAALEISPP